ncbi:MAG: hypothetical protein GWN01_10610, partial [Nitrosopumilaceae archaeon]|nr:hypothetical protein [Nitrosopumilaceae archaeon]NIU87688.1 hypothetical protein [Nitrosopumilaceae archaeon]NIX61946.1 hypothetical protein [Nitrosopumilaceae archaeon]
MKKFSLFLILSILFIFACAEKSEDTKLTEGTPEYQLANQLSSTLPYLNPSENNALISSNEFKITTGEVISNIQRNMGNRANQLTNLNETQLKSNIKRFANILGEKELFLTAAEEEDIQISQAEIDSALNVQYNSAGGEEQFLKFLTNRGLKIEDVKNDIAEGLKIQKYIKRVVDGDINVTSEDIQDAYN